MMVYALVDYDNVKIIEKERSIFDVQFNIARIANRCAEVAKANYAGCREVAIRFYGGWTDKANCRTAAGSWIYGSLGQARRKILGVRVTPEVVTNNIACDLPPFIGLYRDGGQKMVDTLLVADMVWIASQYDCPIILLCDDEDMLPGVVATKNLRNNLTISRKRKVGEAPNDDLLTTLKINVEGPVT